MGHVAYLNEDEIAALVDRISDACDGERAVMILVAFSDMLADIASSEPSSPLASVVSELVSLTMQRHGVNNTQAIN
jgi:hypothetical protein